MKIYFFDEKEMTLFLNKCYSENLNLDSKGELEQYFKDIFLKIHKYYDITLHGYYNIVLYHDKNYGIIQANSCGLIDESYSGNNDQWFFPAIAMRDTVIRVNDRICQFRIMEHQPEILFEETEVLTAEDRGGFGSTGRQ